MNSKNYLKFVFLVLIIVNISCKNDDSGQILPQNSHKITDQSLSYNENIKTVPETHCTDGF
jgi:hypothetical protein